MNTVAKLILSLIFIFYPIFIYLGMKEDRHLLHFAGLILILLFLRWLFFRTSKNALMSGLNYAGLVSFILIIFGMIYKEYEVLKLYPITVHITLAIIFYHSLTGTNTPVVETLARVQNGALSESGISYTRKVTRAWVIFFILNATLSLYTLIFTSLEFWTLFNGFISYLLIVSMFSVEYYIRKRMQKKESFSQKT